MTGTWVDIFKDPNLQDAQIGDEVVINIVTYGYQRSRIALIRKKVQRATDAHLWVDGIKFRHDGRTARKPRKSSRTCTTLYEMTSEREAYLQATGR